MTPEVASLLLRQHAALMDEGIGPENGSPEDLDTLNEAWALVRRLGMPGFTVHWGYEFNFVDKGVHATDCTCNSARVDRGEIFFCGSCAMFQDANAAHNCQAARAIRWFAS